MVYHVEIKKELPPCTIITDKGKRRVRYEFLFDAIFRGGETEDRCELQVYVWDPDMRAWLNAHVGKECIIDTYMSTNKHERAYYSDEGSNLGLVLYNIIHKGTELYDESEDVLRGTILYEREAFYGRRDSIDYKPRSKYVRQAIDELYDERTKDTTI